MNSIAMAITNAGIVVVNAVAGIAGAGAVTALTSMTTLGTIAVFAGAAGVLMVVLSAVSALAGTIRFSSTAEALSFYQTPIKDGDKGYAEALSFYQTPIKDGDKGYEEVRTYYGNYLQDHAFGANQARWDKAKQLYKDGYTLGDLDSQDPKKKTPEKRALAFLNASESILDAEVKSNKHLEKTYLSDACTNQCAENVKRLFTPPQDQSESTETDQINVPIADERVPDALFDASIQEYSKVFVMIAANADRPGGGLWWGNAQEEAVYASTNLVLYAAPFYKMPSSESPLKPLSRMGYTYVQHDATAFKEISTGFNFKTFSPIYAANPDFRKYYSMAQDHLLTSKGHQEFISISYTNYYQTIAHAAEFKDQNHDQNTLIKLNAIGCGAFFNPHFLVAATARLAIEDASGDFPTCMPDLQFSIAGNSSNDKHLRATFHRIMNQTSLKDVRLMLDRGSPSYRKEMLAFAKQREPDQRSYGDSEHGPGDFLNKIKAQMETSGPLEVSPSPSNTLSIPAGSAPSPSSKSRAAASSTDSAASRGPGSGSN